MSVSLHEVVEAGGYDLTTLDDARWLLGQQSNFADLVEKAEETIEQLEGDDDEN
jgi:hypothetical protein